MRKPLLLVIFNLILILGVFGVSRLALAASEDEDVIPDQYIVVLKDQTTSVDQTVDDLAETYKVNVKGRYKRILKGFTTKTSKANLEKIKRDSRVAFVSQDHQVHLINPSEPVVQAGSGLTATYFDNKDLTGASVSRVEPTVNFSWSGGSPDSSIDSNTFSARFEGKLLPNYSQNYTFYVKSNDGARLWVNNQLVIDNWVNQGSTEVSGSLDLNAGQLYELKLEYFDNTGIALVQLRWSSNSQIKQIIPSSSLFLSDSEVTPTPTPTPSLSPSPTPTPTPVLTQSLQTSPTGVRRIGVNPNNQGEGVTVAVLDTGIDLTHPDLVPNIVANTNCLDTSRSGNDDNGHGTHIAGTIAAVDNSDGVVGVAPKAKLAAVKVLSASGSGTWSSIVCGIDWAIQNAANFNIKVANMSLGGSGVSDNNCGLSNSDALHSAICRAREAGITFVVAAGNNARSTNKYVPASYDDAVVTVSALADSDGAPFGVGKRTIYGADDTFAKFSNYGPAVDLGAPGVGIYSTYYKSRYATMSGTSMAAPHVAGAAALYLSSHPGSSWSQVLNGLKSVAETLGNGHTDPSAKHPEPIVRTNQL